MKSSSSDSKDAIQKPLDKENIESRRKERWTTNELHILSFCPHSLAPRPHKYTAKIRKSKCFTSALIT
eukprot:scaffold2451_cov184-Ochromonas_danica.AAC.2